MSSKGQVVIPEEIRNRLGLRAGDSFLVMSDDDVVILKTLTNPPLSDIRRLISEVRKQGKIAGIKKSDIEEAIAQSRKRK
jgi:AbrB family looped-hinge helix DNA binding protein